MRVISFDLGTRNMAFAYVEAPHTILRWGLIDLSKHQARVATASLIETLEGDHRWMRESGDHVVVELQPGNGVCKTLSHVMQAYFDMSDRCDQRERLFVFMQAGNKLKYDTEVLLDVRPQTKNDRKKVTMRVTEKLLNENAGKFRDFYRAQGYKQRTDLADALVQACRFLQIQTNASR